MSDKNTNESLMKTWAETQQKLLTDWLDTLRKLGGTPTLQRWTGVGPEALPGRGSRSSQAWPWNCSQQGQAHRSWAADCAYSAQTPGDWSQIKEDNFGERCTGCNSSRNRRPE